jgi:hypothetical protein
MGYNWNVYTVLVGKLEGKTPREEPRRKFEDNIKMDIRDVGWGGMDWIHLAQDRDQWRALVNTVENVRNYPVAERLACSQEERSTMILNNNTKADRPNVLIAGMSVMLNDNYIEFKCFKFRIKLSFCRSCHSFRRRLGFNPRSVYMGLFFRTKCH